jgi:tetraacyldisaccharide 4'-kinase
VLFKEEINQAGALWQAAGWAGKSNFGFAAARVWHASPCRFGFCLAHWGVMRERFRAWIETIETFALEVIFEERHDFKARLTRAILFGGSKVFQVIIKIRRWLYNVRIFRDKTLGVQVIAIGNLTVGGTGKTPVVEKFARELRDAGRNVAILSRGYRSKPAPLHTKIVNKLLLRDDQTPPRVVSDGKSLLLDSDLAGDEPYMLASNLKDVVVLVDKDRVKSGRYAIEKFGCDTLLLDDGFQYWDLRGRRHDVVLIDRQQPFGNEHLLPRGTLREPPSHLARAQTIFITKSDGHTAELRERIKKLNSTAAIIECVHQPLYFEDVFTGERKGLDLMAGKKVASLSGIAQPESFEKSLEKLGGELVYAKRFADHHRFTQQEILNAINRSKKRQAEMIVTTQKDAVRFPKIDRRDVPFYFMRVEIKIVDGADGFQDCVRKICFR